ncbi:MAG TPA: trypsin-like peptidase domain-containing protein [Desulfosporosinus sp.]
MEDETRLPQNDTITPSENTNTLHPVQRKPKMKLIATASLCLISAVIGGLTTVAAVPYIYPTKTLSPTQTANSSITQVANLTANQTNFPVAQIAKNLGPAVVGVSNFQSGQSRLGNSGLQEAGSGSGFIIDAQKGYIVTNNHVIDGAQKITVSLSDGRNLVAKVIGADPRTDLAVLQISDTKNLTAAKLGDSSKLEVGEPVVAIGNPGGNEFARSVTTGVISATNRTLGIQGESSFDLIQTDAAINPGNSGGPLVDYQGQVIGINSAKYAQQGFEGMGFSIPISDAMPTIQQLMASGVATHPALLVSTDDQYNTYAQTNNKPLGAYIAAVTPNGPAAKAGIVKGDVITKINTAQVQNSSNLIHELYKYKVGDKVTVTYIRDGQTKQVQATLGEVSSNQ